MIDTKSLSSLPSDFWLSVLADDQTWLFGAVVAVSLVFLVVTCRLMWRLKSIKSKQATNSTGNILSNDAGVSTIEFALVLPILLFLFLVLAQTTLLMGGNIFIHYAAFTATRSAIVYIPQDTSDPVYWSGAQGGGDIANVYTHSPGQTKYDVIMRTAVLALEPVCGKYPGGNSALADRVVAGLHRYYSAYGNSSPAWIDNYVGDRIRYGQANTEFEIWATTVTNNTVNYQRIGSGSSYDFEPKEPVTVNVNHRFNLSIPWVNKLIWSDGQQEMGNRFYRNMSAYYTLTNEGIRDELPPLPTLPRRP